MAGPSVGHIEVTVDADTSELKAKITAAARIAGESAREKIDKELGDIGKQKLDRALARVREKIDRALAGVAVDIGVEDTKLKADLKRLQAELKAQELNLLLDPEINDRKMAAVLSELRAAIGEVDVPIGADVDSSELRAALAEIEARIALVHQNIDVGIVEHIGPEIEEIKARLKAAFAGHAAEAEIGVSVDKTDLAKTQQQLKQSFGKAGSDSGKSFGQNFLGGLSLQEKAIVAAVAFLGEPIALALEGVASLAAQVAGSAFQAIGAAAGAAAPLVFGLAAGLGAVVIGSQGMTTAFKSIRTEWKTAQKEGRDFNAQAEEITNALKELSPAAADTAVAFLGMQDQLGAIQRSIQESLFAGMGDVLRDLATTVIPDVGAALVIAAGQANTFAKDFVGALKTIDFSQLVGNLTPAMDSLSKAIAAVVSAIGPFIEAATPAATRLAEMLRLSADSLLRMVEAGQKSGAINQFLQDGLTALSTWWDLLKNIGSLLFTIFQAGADSGTGLIRALSDIVAKWNEWLNTPDGQAALLNFFAVGKQLLSDLKPVLDGIIGLFQALTSPAAVESFGNLTKAIGDVLPVVGELLAIISRAGISSALVAGIDAIAKAITPALPALSDLATAIGGGLAQVVGDLAPLFTILADGIAKLAPKLKPLIPAIVAVADALGKGLEKVLPIVVDLILKLVDALAPLVPIVSGILVQAIGLLADVLAQLLPVLAPVIDAFGKELGKQLPILAKAFNDMLVAITPLIPLLVTLVSQVLQILAPLMPVIVGSFITWLTVTASLWVAMAPLLEVLLQLVNNALALLAPLLTVIVGAFATLAAFLPQVVTLFTDLVGVIAGAIAGALPAIGQFFLDLPGNIVSWITTGFDKVVEIGSNVINWLWQGMQSVFWQVVDFFTSLPGKIVDWITSGSSAIVSVGGDLISWISDGIDSVVDTLAEWWRNLPGNIANWVSSAFSTIVDIGKKIIGWVLDGIKQDVSFVTDWFSDIGDLIWGAVKAASGSIIDVGKSIVNWIIDGIGSLGGAITDKIKSFIPSPGDILGSIGSTLNPFDAEGGIYAAPTPKIIGEAGREAVIPLDRPLSLVDPSVRNMAALLRGQTLQPTSDNGSAINKQVNVYQTITPQSADPVAVAAQVINRAAAMAN